MALKDLLTDLSNFKYTNYENAGANNSQTEGRHGGTVGPTPAQPPHPDTHSDLDDGVGFGVYPRDNPQSFDVRGYTITGTKTFDRPNQDAITIMTNRVGLPYTPFESGVKTGPVDFFSGVKSSWGDGTLPLGFSFNMVDSLLSPGTPPVLSLNTLRHTIPEVGPSPEFTFSNIPKLADAHSIDSLSRLTGYNGIYIASQGEINQTVGAPSISSNGITFTG
ncbi:MAG: hypothetical protein HOG78_00615, partial [Rhodobacterales bacterium]|nr:hypothetical protein [Rhodobacterales bacterium]